MLLSCLKALNAVDGERLEESGDWGYPMGKATNPWTECSFELQTCLRGVFRLFFLWRHLGEALLALLRAFKRLDEKARKAAINAWFEISAFDCAMSVRFRPNSVKASPLPLCCPVWRTVKMTNTVE